MVEAFQSGGIMMWPVLLGLIALAVVAVRAALAHSTHTRDGDTALRSAADAVLFWGGFSALLGVMGTLIGIAQVARFVSQAGGASAGLIWGGIGVTLTTTVFGLIVLVLALVTWYVLRMVADRRVPV